VSGLPRPGSDVDPIGAERLAAQADDIESIRTRPTTGADGTAYRWWQFLGGLLGWVAAAFLIWYFGHGATDFGWQMTAFVVLVALVVGVLGSFIAVEVVRPALVRSRRREVPHTQEAQLSIDRLGRHIVGAYSLRFMRGEVVVQFDRDGNKWFVRADQLEAWQREHS